MNTIIKITIGVFLALLLIFFVRVAYVNYVMKEMTESITEITNNQKERSMQLLRQQQAKIEAQKRKTILEQQEKQRKIALAKELGRKKDLAWFKYYKEPKECMSYESDQNMVECSNKRIRAKRVFEKLWAESAH